MKYADYFFAWTMLVVAILFMVGTETFHLRGAILEDPFIWLLAAMINFLRLSNVNTTVKGLKAICIGANLIVVTLEVVRYGLYGNSIIRTWGPFTLIVAFAALGETLFSVLYGLKEL